MSEAKEKRLRTAAERAAFDRAFLSESVRLVAGVDEVGRGPLAGPVVCAAVVLPLGEEEIVAGVNDSKALSAKERERLSALIRERAAAYAICLRDHAEIDRLNILEATRLCMRDCIEALSVRPDLVLVDGNFVPDVNTPCKSVIGGDALSYSIGAASILAKVYRDALMDEYDALYPQYGFAKNKGYGTKMHTDAIGEYGLCEIHRRTFTKKVLERAGKSGRQTF